MVIRMKAASSTSMIFLPIYIVVNGKLLARGDVVVIDDNFGVRITEILGTRELLESLKEDGSSSMTVPCPNSMTSLIFRLAEPISTVTSRATPIRRSMLPLMLGVGEPCTVN